MSKLLDFYRDSGNPYKWSTIVGKWTDLHWEGGHDYIQWVFPTQQPSNFNPDAPLLSEDDIKIFKADPELQERLELSFARFLAFVGLKYENGEVKKADDFETKRAVWRTANHNWLRITRVLTSLRLLGKQKLAEAFYDYLKWLFGVGIGISGNTFGYWQQAMGE